jgi:3-phenylpropionate/trans-cinnamate dioxygenase ferredoxin reductase component
MAAARRPFVIVGANLAGGAAASTLRAEGYDGPLVLIGAEPHPPYERPPLSKEYLRGETTFEASYLRPPSWYEEAGIDLRLGARVTSIDPAAREVRVEDGTRVEYEQLLLATGGRNRRLDVPGADLDGILELRTIEDADRIRAEAATATKVVVVGAGFIGCEVAASLRTMGLDVEVIEVFEAPLVRVLGPEVAGVMESIHRDHGVGFHLGQAVTSFEGGERVQAVVTDRGTRVEGDLVVVGVGIVPNDELAAAAGIATGNGILVDERCRTSVEGVYAAGDVANHRHPVFGRRVRVEHYDNALKQGSAAARNMMGRDEDFADPHWFWSDQFGHNLQYAGFAPQWDELVVRGSVEERRFVAFYLKGGLVRAAAGLDRGRDVRRAAGLISPSTLVDPDDLANEEVDLRTLAPAHGRSRS